jgi:WhiB family redox-sensing transcriptional regulator
MTAAGSLEGLINREAWVEQAVCAQTGAGDTWYPERGNSARNAKRICWSCPVRAQCLAYALNRNEPFGVWGGYSDRERRQMRRDVIA